jgi:hypothetical protein
LGCDADSSGSVWNAESGTMSIQRRNEANQFDPDRDPASGRRLAKRPRSVAQSIMRSPAGSRADDADRRESWFSFATVHAVIALTACGAAAVAAIYGPVFTQPVMGP